MNRQRIVCAAIRSKTTGRILCGARHMDFVMRQFTVRRRFWLFGRRCLRAEWKSPEQGFIDQFGNFLTRSEAYFIAKLEGQVIGRSSSSHDYGPTLFSEDLY